MRLRDEGGFSLLEAIVALTIVSMAGVAALSTVGTQIRSADRAQHYLEAAALAEGRMAALTLMSESELEPLPDSLEHGVFAQPMDGFEWVASARRVPGEERLFDLNVSVSWGQGSFELTTRTYRPAATSGRP